MNAEWPVCLLGSIRIIELVISSPINCVYKPETEVAKAVKAVVMYCESYTCCCHLYQIWALNMMLLLILPTVLCQVTASIC